MGSSEIQIVKRGGNRENFSVEKIKNAINKAFLSVGAFAADEDLTAILSHGTCLPANSKETSPGYWYNTEYEWGYVDNFSSIDRLTTDINYGAAANGNHFRISDAIDYKGNHGTK